MGAMKQTTNRSKESLFSIHSGGGTDLELRLDTSIPGASDGLLLAARVRPPTDIFSTIADGASVDRGGPRPPQQGGSDLLWNSSSLFQPVVPQRRIVDTDMAQKLVG